MKAKSLLLLFCLTILINFSSCAVVGGIFKAGMGVGIFIVIVVIALIIFLVSRMGNKK